MRRVSLLLVALAIPLVMAGTAGAYGGGSSHDTWQIGLSFNCNNPSYCGNDLGGFWGWVEFDRWSDGSITGDAELTGCGHSVGGGGPGSAGAGHLHLDATAAHIAGGNFFVDHNEVTYTGRFSGSATDDPDFLGDTGIPAAPGHYSFHPAPGVTMVINVSYRAAS